MTCNLTLPLVEKFEAGQQDLIVVKPDSARPDPGSLAPRQQRRSAWGWRQRGSAPGAPCLWCFQMPLVSIAAGRLARLNWRA